MAVDVTTRATWKFSGPIDLSRARRTREAIAEHARELRRIWRRLDAEASARAAEPGREPGDRVVSLPVRDRRVVVDAVAEFVWSLLFSDSEG